MTAPGAAVEDHVSERPAPSRVGALRLAASALPWVIVLVAVLVAWDRGDVPVADAWRFAAYWAVALVLPGTLVHRALRGGRGNLPEDLGYGAATGLVLELVVWAGAAATGQQSLLRWWPAPVLLAFLAVPGLRRHWRVGPRRPLPVAWHWAICVVLLLVLGWAMTQWRHVPLPPATSAYYQDLFYHLGLAQELTRSMPFRLPHVAGEALRYHYLSDAHVATGSMITGIPPAVVLLRLWLVPVSATAVLLLAGLARDLSRTAWAGPVAAAGGLLGLPVLLGSPVSTPGGSPLSLVSISQTYVLVPMLLLAGICLDVVRDQRLGRAWPLVPLLGLACAGSKSSALPPVIAGLGLATLVGWWVRRRVPWAAFGALACLVAAMGVGFVLFAGGGASSLRPQLFGVIRFMLPYTETLGAGDRAAPGGLLPPGLADAGRVGWLLGFALLGWWVLTNAPRWAGLSLLVTREHRADPAGWLLGGAVLAGAGATWVTYHPTASQLYFWLGVVPFGALLAAGWLVAARQPWPVPVVTALAGAVVTLAVPFLGRPERRLAAWNEKLADSVVRFAVFVALAALLGVGVAALARRIRPVGAPRIGEEPVAAEAAPSGAPAGERATGRRRWVAAALVGVTAALLGGSVATGVDSTVTLLSRPAGPVYPSRFALTADEARAALWLDAHAGADDVVATNVHCQPVATVAHCDARAFWVTGLGGRRAVVESWGYTDAALAAQGRYGLGYVRQDPPDPALLAFNDGVFTAPTPADLDRMVREYDVRWLFADSRAGAVSPELAGLARVRLVAGPVTIYELNRP
ncbi:hypothetical protein V6U81_09055 [Micromonospora sp. CPCC 205711]|uniref:hypothetical protein n=1 Tax=Micromonospora sp. CPCC 205547 TaxID=3122400 RepID=UPI002FF1004B